MIKEFPDPLLLKDVKTVNGTQVFELLADFRFISPTFGEIIVPKGFRSTGASIPRIFWSIMAPTGKYFYSSLFHDLGYSKNCNYNWTRKQVDNLFMECMEVQNVDVVTRWLIYTAVRIFGWKFFRK